MNAARGTVIKRGATFSVVLDLGRDEAGRRIRKWHAGYKTKIDAEVARTALLSAIDQQTYVAPSKMTIKQFTVDRWLPSLDALVAAGKLKPSTVANYRTLMNSYIVPKLGPTILKDLTADQLARLYGSLLTSGRRRAKGPTTLSPTTVHHVHIAVHRMLKDAQRWGIVARNVADVASADAPRPAKRDMRERVWSPEQLGSFLRTVSEDRLFALWMLVATTGLRRGELAGLCWREIDFDGGRLTVSRARVVVNHEVLDSDPKTERSGRTIGLDPATVRALRSHRAQQSAERLAWGSEYQANDLVFVWEDGRPLHPDLISRQFKRRALESKLPVITVHGLRHSYASAALEAGVSMKIVSDRLGHSGLAITADLYTHVRPEVDQAAAEQVAALILGGHSG